MHSSSALPSHPWGHSGGSKMSNLLQEALVSPVPRVPTAQPCQLPPPALTCAKKRQHRKGDPKRANTGGSELTSDMQYYLGKQAPGRCQAQVGQRSYEGISGGSTQLCLRGYPPGPLWLLLPLTLPRLLLTLLKPQADDRQPQLWGDSCAGVLARPTEAVLTKARQQRLRGEQPQR